MTHYEAGRFDEAAEKFKQAFEADGTPLYLFTWAQAEVGRDDCRAAVGIFRRYLDTNPPKQNKEAAEARMATCAERLAAPPLAGGQDAGAVQPGADAAVADAGAAEAVATAPVPIYVPPPVLAPRSAVPAPDRGVSSPWYTDPLGMVLLGTGVLATGVGTGFLVASYSKESELKDGAFNHYDEHSSAIDSAQRQRLIGGITSGVGVGLMALGVVRLLTRDTSEPRAQSGVWMTPRGAGLSAGSAF